MPKAARRPSTRRARPTFRWRGFLLLCAIYLAVAFLWSTLWVAPLRLFVVLLHEISHGLAALLTGGRVLELQVFADEGGHCVTEGGSPVAIASAGYLGSMAFGAALLLVATRTRWSRVAAAVLGLLVVGIALLYIPEAPAAAAGAGAPVLDGAQRPLAADLLADPRFGRWFALGCGTLLALLALPPALVAEFALRVVGVTSCLYAILDVKQDVLDTRHASSDAATLAGLTGVPALVWGIAWIAVSLVVTALAAKWAVTGVSPRARPVQSARG